MNLEGTDNIVVWYSAEDQGYLAKHPDLPYFVAFGDTEAEAKEELLVSIAAMKADLPINTR